MNVFVLPEQRALANCLLQGKGGRLWQPPFMALVHIDLEKKILTLCAATLRISCIPDQDPQSCPSRESLGKVSLSHLLELADSQTITRVNRTHCFQQCLSGISPCRRQAPELFALQFRKIVSALQCASRPFLYVFQCRSFLLR